MGKRWRKKRRKILNGCGRIKKNHTKHLSQKSLVTDGNSSNRISLLKNIIWGYNYKSIGTTMVCIVSDEHIHKNIKKKKYNWITIIYNYFSRFLSEMCTKNVSNRAFYSRDSELRSDRNIILFTRNENV